MEQVESYKVNAVLLDQIITYLSKRPYEEVFKILNELLTTAQPINKETENIEDDGK